MTQKDLKKFAKKNMMKIAGIKMPMSHMDLIEWHINIRTRTIDDVCFTDNTTGIDWEVGYDWVTNFKDIDIRL